MSELWVVLDRRKCGGFHDRGPDGYAFTDADAAHSAYNYLANTFGDDSAWLIQVKDGSELLTAQRRGELECELRGAERRLAGVQASAQRSIDAAQAQVDALRAQLGEGTSSIQGAEADAPLSTPALDA